MTQITNLTGPASVTPFYIQPTDSSPFFKPIGRYTNTASVQYHGLYRLYEPIGGYIKDRLGSNQLSIVPFTTSSTIHHRQTEHGEVRVGRENTASAIFSYAHNMSSGIIGSGTSISIWVYFPSIMTNGSTNDLTSRRLFGDGIACDVWTNSSARWRVLTNNQTDATVLGYGPETNKWMNITFTYQATSNLSGVTSVYLNGNVLAQNKPYPRPVNDVTTFQTGALLTPEHRLLEVKVYNKILTVPEIINLSNPITRWDLYNPPTLWALPSTSTNSPFTLYISGSVALLNENITLYSAGIDASNSGIPLFLSVAEQSSGNIPLYIAGGTTVPGGVDFGIWGHTSGDFRTFTQVPIKFKRNNWGRRPVPANILDDNRNFLGVWDFSNIFEDKIFDRSRRNNHLVNNHGNNVDWPSNFFSYGANTATSEKLHKKVLRNVNATKLVSTDNFKTSTSKSFAVSVWVFFDSYTRSSIFGNYIESSNSGFFLNQQTDGTLQFFFLQSSTKYYVVNFPAPPQKQWVNITLTCDGNQSTTNYQNGINIYYDGELQPAISRTRTGSPDTAEYGSTFYIGRTIFSVFDTYNAFNGMISSCILSNKIMSQTEIRKLAYDYYFNIPFTQNYIVPLIVPDGGGQNKLSLYVSGTQLFSNNNVTLFLKNTITSFDGTRVLATIYKQRRQNWQGKAAPKQLVSNRRDAVGIWRSEDGDKDLLQDYSDSKNHLIPKRVDDFEYVWATDAGSVTLMDGRKVEKPVVTLAGDSAFEASNSGLYQYSIYDNFTINLWGKFQFEDFKSLFGTINNYLVLEGYSLITFPNNLLFLMGNSDINYSYVEYQRPPSNRYNMITVKYGGPKEVDTYGPVSGAPYGIELYYNAVRQTPTSITFNGTFDDWKKGDGPFYIGKSNNIGIDSITGQFSSLSIFNRELSDREIKDLYHDFYLNTYFEQITNVPLIYTSPINVPLFVKAPEPSNNNLPLYVQVPEPSNSGLFLSISGDANVYNNIPLYIKADINNNLNLFLAANLGSGVAPLPLFVKVREPDLLNNSITLSVDGFSPGSPGALRLSSFEPTLFVSGSIPVSNSSMIMFLPGADIATVTDSMILYIGGNAPSLANSVDLSVYNTQVTNNVPLFVQGLSLSSSPDAVPSDGTEYSQGMNLFIARNTPGEISLFLCNNLINSGGIPLSTFGAYLTSNSTNLVIPNTIGLNTSTVKLFTHGF